MPTKIPNLPTTKTVERQMMNRKNCETCIINKDLISIMPKGF